MKGFWIYAVYSYNPKNGNRNNLAYFKENAKAEAYCINCDIELRRSGSGRRAGVKALWVEE